MGQSSKKRKVCVVLWYNILAVCCMGPHRLAVRTSGSHPGNPGSIPGGVTKEDFSGSERSFLLAAYL